MQFGVPEPHDIAYIGGFSLILTKFLIDYLTFL